MTAKNGGQSREREARPSACAVCGDAATGYNYGAASCGSCKAFFRRAVVTKQVFSCCLRSGICAKEPSLKPCRACRYEKCIAGGMQPEFVGLADVSETAKIRALSMDNASVECETSGGADATDEAPSDPAPSTSRQDDDVAIVAKPFRIESRMEAMMLNLVSLEAAHHKLRISTYTPRLSPTSRIDDFAFVHSKLGEHFEQMYSPAMELFAEMLFPVEVLIKMRIVIDLKDFDWSARKLWVIQDVIYTIEFIKALPIYQLMDDSSKKVMAASALVCTNITVAFYSYSQNSDRTIYPDGSVITWSAEIQGQAPSSTRFHNGLIAALREVDIDAREYALLKLIIICNPILDGLKQYDATLLQHEKERCTKTLISYVLSRSGVDEGPARFARILSIVDLATKLTSWQKGAYITSFALGLAKPVSPFAESVFASH